MECGEIGMPTEFLPTGSLCKYPRLPQYAAIEVVLKRMIIGWFYGPHRTTFCQHRYGTGSTLRRQV